MIAIEFTRLDDEDQRFVAESPEVPFPGDEVVCGPQWGIMRVVRRSFVYARSGALSGAIVWVRREGQE